MDCQRPIKRPRLASPITPESESDNDCTTTKPTSLLAVNTSLAASNTLSRALNVLQTEAEALAHISNLYATNSKAQHGLQATINALLQTQKYGGKLITCGVGKSSYIAMKLTGESSEMLFLDPYWHRSPAIIIAVWRSGCLFRQVVGHVCFNRRVLPVCFDRPTFVCFDR